MERLSTINNDQRWLVAVWFAGFGVFLSGAAVLLAMAIAELIHRFGLANMGSGLLLAGSILLIAAFVIDVPLALIRRSRRRKELVP